MNVYPDFQFIVFEQVVHVDFVVLVDTGGYRRFVSPSPAIFVFPACCFVFVRFLRFRNELVAIQLEQQFFRQFTRVESIVFIPINVFTQ